MATIKAARVSNEWKAEASGLKRAAAAVAGYFFICFNKRPA
jgi:hypothetical protein